MDRISSNYRSMFEEREENRAGGGGGAFNPHEAYRNATLVMLYVRNLNSTFTFIASFCASPRKMCTSFHRLGHRTKPGFLDKLRLLSMGLVCFLFYFFFDNIVLMLLRCGGITTLT